MLIVDCDTGIDDAFAVVFAAVAGPGALRALTTVWGNVPVHVGARNNLALLDLVGLDVPVALGAAGPSNGKPAWHAEHVHGADGQGGKARPAPAAMHVDRRPADELIVELARRNPGELDLVAVGPLTTIASALQRDPAVATTLRSLTIMGGAANAPGNATPVAEANIFHDPEAAAAVFAAEWSSVTLVPLDVTMRVLLTEEHRARLAAGGEVGQYLAAICDFYFDFNAQASFDRRCSPMHDAVAVAIAMGALEVTHSAQVSVEIDASGGPGRGQTICDTRQRYRGYSRPTGPVRLVLDVAPGFPELLVGALASA